MVAAASVLQRGIIAYRYGKPASIIHPISPSSYDIAEINKDPIKVFYNDKIHYNAITRAISFDSDEDDQVFIADDGGSDQKISNAVSVNNEHAASSSGRFISKTKINSAELNVEELSGPFGIDSKSQDHKKRCVLSDLAIPSPIQTQVSPSAHKDMDDMLELIEESVHYVYGLILLNLDGTLNHCFYVGETWSPQDRLISQKKVNMIMLTNLHTLTNMEENG
uniref:Uncharacterized protein n=1 Tax=Panagrolaimus sp. ES5 TaxID=591445 RepID=A0AC34FYU3_9BILA